MSTNRRHGEPMSPCKKFLTLVACFGMVIWASFAHDHR